MSYCSIIECYNTNKKIQMKVIFEINRNCRWVDILDKIVRNVIIQIIERSE